LAIGLTLSNSTIKAFLCVLSFTSTLCMLSPEYFKHSIIAVQRQALPLRGPFASYTGSSQGPDAPSSQRQRHLHVCAHCTLQVCMAQQPKTDAGCLPQQSCQHSHHRNSDERADKLAQYSPHIQTACCCSTPAVPPAVSFLPAPSAGTRARHGELPDKLPACRERPQARQAEHALAVHWHA